MMRVGLLIACLLAALALGAGLWWPLAPLESTPVAVSPPRTGAVSVPAPPPSSPPSQPVPAQPVPTATEDESVDTPAVDAAAGLDPSAIASLRESMLHGDDRAPPIGRRRPVERPTAEELDSPEGYLQYEGRQERQLKAAFVRAVDEEIPLLQQHLAEARSQGLAPELLVEGEEKLRRLQAMKEELLMSDPELGNTATQARPAPDVDVPDPGISAP